MNKLALVYYFYDIEKKLDSTLEKIHEKIEISTDDALLEIKEMANTIMGRL